MLWAELFLVIQMSASAGCTQSLLHKAPHMSNCAGPMQCPPRTTHGTFGRFPNFHPCYCILPRQCAISSHQLSLCRRKMKVIRQKMNEPHRETRYAIERIPLQEHTGCFKTRYHFRENDKLGLLTPLVHLE